jgi:hypothetical protein
MFRLHRRFPSDWIAYAVICLALHRTVLKSARPPHRSNVLQVWGLSERPRRRDPAKMPPARLRDTATPGADTAVPRQ